MKKVVQTLHKILNMVSYLPLTAFLGTYRFTHSWPQAFVAGACVAVVSLAVNAVMGERFERFLLAANIFLIGGGLGVAGMYFDLDGLMNLYRVGMQSTLLVSLLLVGLVTTFATRGGFLGADKANPKKVRQYSLYLLGATVVGTAGAIYFSLHDSGMLAGFVPFVVLKLLAKELNKKLKS